MDAERLCSLLDEHPSSIDEQRLLGSNAARGRLGRKWPGRLQTIARRHHTTILQIPPDPARVCSTPALCGGPRLKYQKDAEGTERSRAHNYHNDPLGYARTSFRDEAVTCKVQQILDLIDVKVLDQMIVTEEIFSFAEAGLL